MASACGLYRRPPDQVLGFFQEMVEIWHHIGTARTDQQVPRAAQTEIPAASALPLDMLDWGEAMDSVCDLYM